MSLTRTLCVSLHHSCVCFFLFDFLFMSLFLEFIFHWELRKPNENVHMLYLVLYI
jgi:hypothetical protein